jgi:hypothetical protein
MNEYGVKSIIGFLFLIQNEILRGLRESALVGSQIVLQQEMLRRGLSDEIDQNKKHGS